jgi:hypothetical protein
MSCPYCACHATYQSLSLAADAQLPWEHYRNAVHHAWQGVRTVW